MNYLYIVCIAMLTVQCAQAADRKLTVLKSSTSPVLGVLSGNEELDNVSFPIGGVSPSSSPRSSENISGQPSLKQEIAALKVSNMQLTAENARLAEELSRLREQLSEQLADLQKQIAMGYLYSSKIIDDGSDDFLH